MEQTKVYATSKYVQMSPQKVRLVVDLIRGQDAIYAAEMLGFVSKVAARPVKKTLESAIANAENNFEMDRKKLRVIEARVNEAPTFKRGRAVSKGRYHQIIKRNSHIIIAVSDGTVAKAKKIKPVITKSADTTKEENLPKKLETKKANKSLLKKIVRKDQVATAGVQRKVQSKGN